MYGADALLDVAQSHIDASSPMLTSLRSWLGDQVLRLGSRVHQAIAVLALLVIVGDALTYQSFKTVSGGFFDTLVTLRPSTPKPDPKVVIVDIDEGSLAEVGKTHGRWPCSQAPSSPIARTQCSTPTATRSSSRRGRLGSHSSGKPAAG